MEVLNWMAEHWVHCENVRSSGGDRKWPDHGQNGAFDLEQKTWRSSLLDHLVGADGDGGLNHTACHSSAVTR
jgi:hypothetical protein